MNWKRTGNWFSPKSLTLGLDHNLYFCPEGKNSKQLLRPSTTSLGSPLDSMRKQVRGGEAVRENGAPFATPCLHSQGFASPWKPWLVPILQFMNFPSNKNLYFFQVVPKYLSRILVHFFSILCFDWKFTLRNTSFSIPSVLSMEWAGFH